MRMCMRERERERELERDRDRAVCVPTTVFEMIVLFFDEQLISTH